MPSCFYGIVCELTLEIGGEAYVIKGTPAPPEDAALKESWVIIEDDGGDVLQAVRLGDVRLVEVA